MPLWKLWVRLVSVQQRPGNITTELLVTVHSCSEHCMVTARITSEWPESIKPLSETFTLLWKRHSFSHCGHFWNGQKTLSGVYTVLPHHLATAPSALSTSKYSGCHFFGLHAPCIISHFCKSVMSSRSSSFAHPTSRYESNCSVLWLVFYLQGLENIYSSA